MLELTSNHISKSGYWSLCYRKILYVMHNLVMVASNHQLPWGTTSSALFVMIYMYICITSTCVYEWFISNQIILITWHICEPTYVFTMYELTQKENIYLKMISPMACFGIGFILIHTPLINHSKLLTDANLWDCIVFLDIIIFICNLNHMDM